MFDFSKPYKQVLRPTNEVIGHENPNENGNRSLLPGN